MRSFKVLIMMAAFGQGTCASRPPMGVKPTEPEPPAAKPDEKLFDDGRPDLPANVPCLAWPMDGNRRVTSGFKDPKHPFVPGKHDGTDLAAPVGTPVLSSVGGEVDWVRGVAAGQDAAVGIRFDEAWTFETHHLSRVDVAKGDTVARGQALGLSGGAVGAPGSGPWTTGPHLHFSLLHGKAYVNAAQYFCSSAP